MTEIGDAGLIRVVLADANVLYSRVLHDCLLYAADQEIIAVVWSPVILAEAVEHLSLNVARFDHAAAQRLVTAINRAFPFAKVEPTEEHFRALADVWLPDEDDRHVRAAAVAAAATVLCTWNVKDFPADATAAAGIEVLTPDELFCRLVAEYEPQMIATHRTAVGIPDRRNRPVNDRCPAPSRGFDNHRPDGAPHRRLLNLSAASTSEHFQDTRTHMSLRAEPLAALQSGPDAPR
ncbi:PIN domain-containing protein [Frankia sp. Mgl5]|uniref:PIN domain-containing protein n=1 Tax=Frankia sp. Mgl5 TaxID=2933793 RepID=UPI00200CAED3|nr:PIN domain-containing protein [Frankia sp. Mgl5]MCK9928276.1 PIN domain-containing protein [Frankia sp. Mgl5]